MKNLSAALAIAIAAAGACSRPPRTAADLVITRAAEFQETEKGTTARGKLADLVILSDDFFGIPAVKLKDVTVQTTIAGGRVVYQR